MAFGSPVSRFPRPVARRPAAFAPDRLPPPRKAVGTPARALDVAVQLLKELLARLQAEGKLRGDFDPGVMAVAVRGAIDSVPYPLARDPGLDVDHYAKEIATIFDLATRVAD